MSRGTGGRVDGVGMSAGDRLKGREDKRGGWKLFYREVEDMTVQRKKDE